MVSFSAGPDAMDWAPTPQSQSHAHPDPHHHPVPEVMDWTRMLTATIVQPETPDIHMSNAPDAVDEIADCLNTMCLSDVEMADLIDTVTALAVALDGVQLG